MENKKIKIITHSGNFHTDDVFAVSTLSLLLDKRDEKYEIIRTRDPEIIKTGDFVVDIGWEYDPDKNLFDHHQEGGAGKREDGIPYSSFGLVWKKYGEQLCGSKEAAHKIDKRLCRPIDAADNGVETYKRVSEELFPYVLHNITLVFRPTWKEMEDGSRNDDIAFSELVSLARKILEREIKNAVDSTEGEALVRDAYEKSENKNIIILEGHYPWEDVLSDYPEPLYVVKPDRQNGGKWKIKAVGNDTHTFENRKSLPQEWAGKRDEALVEITGVTDAVFCHNKRFIAVAGSKDGALKLAKLAVEN